MMRTDALAPGRDLGKYRVVRRLAVGGMAEIYLAQARGIEGFAKYVVLKRILPQYAASETFVKLFLNEARVSATLDHPNIASVHDIGAADGVYFFTMEYLHGEDVGHILREMVARRAAIPLEVALTIATGIAAGLHAAHEKLGSDGAPLGIVHRDVSPSNVLVTYGGGVKVVDFGVAKITAQAELTRTGTLKGKVSYMSPEQCNNDPVDRRSDVFSLGVILYELTTQKRLFRTESEAATIKLVSEARVAPPSTRVADYPRELEPIVLKALARNRDDRYGSAREVQMALEEVARKRSLLTSTAGLAEWMVSIFGAKPEPWITPPPTLRDPSGPVIRVRGNEVFTPSPVRATIERATDAPAEAEPAPDDQTLEPGDRDSDEGDEDDDKITDPRRGRAVAQLQRGPQLETLPSDGGRSITRGLGPRRRRRHVMQAAAGVALVIGIVFGAWMAQSPEPPATAAAPAPVVEAAVASPAPLPAPAPAAAAVAAPEATPPVVATTPDLAPAKRSAGRRTAARTEARPQQFSVAFSRREGDLLRCFAEHADAAARAPEISVRFHAGTDGRVTAAEVIPPEVAATPLGVCVAKVAEGTRFGPQASPITFRIPVTVRRVDGRAR